MNKTIIVLSLLSLCVAAAAQENHPNSTDVFYKHLQLNEIVVTDLAYMPHLSRLKYVGIANMGRNVSFKLVVPF